MEEREQIYVLGCGETINDLSEAEVSFINTSRCRLALNKFSGFPHATDLVPTHVYYYDLFSEASANFLGYIFKQARKHRLPSTRYILNRDIVERIAPSWAVYLSKRYAIWRSGTSWKTLYRVPNNARFDFIRTDGRYNEDGPWARSIEAPLYHYRGSLTSALNYLSLNFPKTDIYLVGNDFSGKKYFFQDQLEKVRFETSDWTTPIVQSEGRHFSTIQHEGTSIYDCLPKVVRCLAESENRVFCCNPESLLVKEGGLPYRSILPSR